MKEIRLSRWSDVERLKELWQLCFGDPKPFIDYYFAQRFKPEQVAVLLDENKVASMLTMLPVTIVTIKGKEGQNPVKGAMLYGIATHPDYQKRGYAGELMNWAQGYLGKRGVVCTILVPAEPQLFSFYAKQGYRECFALQELIVNLDDGVFLQGAELLPAEPHYYNKLRNNLLIQSLPRGAAYVAYEEAEVAYQKQVSQFSGADIYTLKVQGLEGCAAVERLTKEKVLVKEFLFPEAYYEQGLVLLLQFLKAKTVILRTPVGVKLGDWVSSRELLAGLKIESTHRAFGMLKITGSFSTGSETEVGLGKEIISISKDSYLGLAFD